MLRCLEFQGKLEKLSILRGKKNQFASRTWWILAKNAILSKRSRRKSRKNSRTCVSIDRLWPSIGTAHAGIYVRMLLCAVSTDKRKGKRHRRRNGFPWKLTNAARFLKTGRFLIANPVSVMKSFLSFFFLLFFSFFSRNSFLYDFSSGTIR